jgi:hypothetical protein
MPDNDFGTNDVGDPVQPCGSNQTQPVYWVEIEMVSEDDQPIPYTEYHVVTPDGEPVKGYLDGNGWARLEGIKASGACQISFPELDKDVWSFIESAGARNEGDQS